MSTLQPNTAVHLKFFRTISCEKFDRCGAFPVVTKTGNGAEMACWPMPRHRNSEPWHGNVGTFTRRLIMGVIQWADRRSRALSLWDVGALKIYCVLFGMIVGAYLSQFVTRHVCGSAVQWSSSDWASVSGGSLPSPDECRRCYRPTVKGGQTGVRINWRVSWFVTEAAVIAVRSSSRWRRRQRSSSSSATARSAR